LVCFFSSYRTLPIFRKYETTELVVKFRVKKQLKRKTNLLTQYMVSKKTVFLIAVAFFFALLEIWSQTSLFYPQASFTPIKVYWRDIVGKETKIADLPSNETIWLQAPDGAIGVGSGAVYGIPIIHPNYTITDVNLKIDDAFNNSNIGFQISCENLTDELHYWESIGNGRFIGNGSRVDEYLENNPPDLAVFSSLLRDERFTTWSQLLSLNGRMDYPCNSFFTHSSYDTWQAEYFFDGSSNSITINNDNISNDNFSTAKVLQMSFSISIPDNYEIQDSQNFAISQHSGYFTITKNLASGETIRIVVTDKNLTSSKTILGWFGIAGIGVPSAIIALFIAKWYEGKSESQFSSTEKTKPQIGKPSKSKYNRKHKHKRKNK
jgi:hypothetical protein